MNSIALDSLKYLLPVILRKCMPSWAAPGMLLETSLKQGARWSVSTMWPLTEQKSAVHKTALSQTWGKTLK